MPIRGEGAEASADPAAQLPPGALPFADASNPILSQVAFLSAVVGPRVAAAAAQAALGALCAEVPVVDADVRLVLSPAVLYRFLACLSCILRGGQRDERRLF